MRECCQPVGQMTPGAAHQLLSRPHFSVAACKMISSCHSDELWRPAAGLGGTRLPLPSPNYRQFYCVVTLIFLNPGLVTDREPYPEPFHGSKSVNRTAQNLSVRTLGQRTAPSHFLSHFVNWEKVVKLHMYLKSAPGHT